MYSPRTNQHLPTQSHHPSGQSWKTVTKNCVQQKCCIKFHLPAWNEPHLFCQAYILVTWDCKTQFPIWRQQNIIWDNSKRGSKLISMVRERNCEQGLYQVLLENNNHTRNLLHPPWKRKIGWKSGSFPPPYIRIQLWVLFPVLCTNNCQDQPHLVRWPGV